MVAEVLQFLAQRHGRGLHWDACCSQQPVEASGCSLVVRGKVTRMVARVKWGRCTWAATVQGWVVVVQQRLGVGLPWRPIGDSDESGKACAAGDDGSGRSLHSVAERLQFAVGGTRMHGCQLGSQSRMVVAKSAKRRTNADGGGK